MTYINTPEYFERLELIGSSDALDRLQRAAGLSRGITVEALPKQSDDDIAEAARKYGQVALGINRYNGRTEHNPYEWEEEAVRTLANGGFVVRVVVSGDKEHLAGVLMGGFRANIRTLEVAEA